MDECSTPRRASAPPTTVPMSSANNSPRPGDPTWAAVWPIACVPRPQLWSRWPQALAIARKPPRTSTACAARSTVSSRPPIPCCRKACSANRSDRPIRPCWPPPTPSPPAISQLPTLACAKLPAKPKSPQTPSRSASSTDSRVATCCCQLPHRPTLPQPDAEIAAAHYSANGPPLAIVSADYFSFRRYFFRPFARSAAVGPDPRERGLHLHETLSERDISSL